jgi:SAM-dependent methyltransferase
MISRSFSQQSYESHAAHFDQYGIEGSKGDLGATWRDDHSVDAWRHTRMYQTLDPVLTADPQARWLTVGDGRFGRDARYILQKGGDALPTDIAETLLAQAVQLGYIQKYQIENAEALSFESDTFDYVFCKESYHHFPRPMIALYEMIRVAKKAVILLEPNDQIATDRPGAAVVSWIKRVWRKVLGRPEVRNQFEVSGNYLFTLSRREIEKVALGMGCPVVAFKGINDEYVGGCEFEPLVDKGPKYQQISRKIRRRDRWCRLHLLDELLLTAMIFKEIPDETVVSALKSDGYEVVFLPKNPYLAHDPS